MDSSMFEFLLDPGLLTQLLPNLSEADLMAKLKSFLTLLQSEKSKVASLTTNNPPPPILIPPNPNNNEEVEPLMSVPPSPTTLGPSPAVFRKQSILQLMVLQLASQINWNLGKLNRHLPIGLQHQLFDCLITSCKVQKILSELNVENAALLLESDTIDNRSIFALTLFCRWILHSVASLPLPLPLGSKVNIYSALPKSTLPVIGNNDQGPLQQWITSQANVALKVLQTLSTEKLTLDNIPSSSSFFIEENQIVCSAVKEWQPLEVRKWLCWSWFDMAKYHICLEDYNAAQNCLEAVKSSLDDKAFSEKEDRLILKGMQQALLTNSKTSFSSSFQVGSSAEAMSKFVEQDDIPLYCRLNFELSASFQQIPQQEKIATLNELHRIEKSQPFSVTNFQPSSISKCTSRKKSKLLTAISKNQQRDQKTEERVELVPCLTEPKTKSVKVRRRIMCSSLFRELRTAKLQKLCSDMTKTQTSARLLSTAWLPNHAFFKKYLSTIPQGNDGDFASLALYKVNQLSRLSQHLEAMKLFNSVEMLDMEKNRASQISPPLRNIQLQMFSRHLDFQLENGLFISEDYQANCRQCLMEMGNFNPDVFEDVLENCLAVLINKQDWDFLFAIADQRWKYLQISQLVLSIAVFFKGGNINMDVKKNSHLLLELLFQLHQPNGNPGKRMRDGGNSLKGSAAFNKIKIFSKIWHPDILQVLASLYISLYNDSVEDSSSRIFHDFPPISLNSSQLPPSLGSDFYLSVLKQIVTQGSVLDSSWCKLKGEILFAHENYPEALKSFIQAMAVNSSYFTKPLPLPTERDDKLVQKMLKCLVELHYNSYAVVMSQFLSDADYSVAFKNLEERRSNDGMDGNYKNIWDVTILEYAVSMHTKKGENSRRRKALGNIGSLEVNTNNNIEILRETAAFKRFSFMRVLCQHFL